jgi:hypothetical protein
MVRGGTRLEAGSECDVDRGSPWVVQFGSRVRPIKQNILRYA